MLLENNRQVICPAICSRCSQTDVPEIEGIFVSPDWLRQSPIARTARPRDPRKRTRSLMVPTFLFCHPVTTLLELPFWDGSLASTSTCGLSRAVSHVFITVVLRAVKPLRPILPSRAITAPLNGDSGSTHFVCTSSAREPLLCSRAAGFFSTTVNLKVHFADLLRPNPASLSLVEINSVWSEINFV
jgi:hypothetical protein